MARCLRLALPVLALLVAACGGEQAAERGPLVGAWQMVEGTYTDADTTVTVTTPQVKILTDGHFAFGRMNPNGAFAGGGRYTFDGSTYTEIVEYHSDTLALRRGELTFDARIEGDSVWFHSGNIGPNFHLEEVWRRIE